MTGTVIYDSDSACFCVREIMLDRCGKVEPNDVCFWIEENNENLWKSECNKKLFSFFDGTPEENGFGFCPYCGRKLKENKPSAENQPSPGAQ